MESAGKSPRVSLGLPVYNGERFLEGMLECLLAQDFDDFEIIISDNASTDRTPEIGKRYAAMDERIQYHCNERNLGLAPNFNRTFVLSRGEYFKWTPCDDRYAPSYLRECVETLDAASDSVVLCYPRTTLVDGEDQVIGEHPDNLDLDEAHPHQRLRHFLRMYGHCNPVVGLMRRSAVERTNLHGAYLSSDVTLLAEFAMLGQWSEVPRPLFFRRIYESSSRQGDRSLRDVAKWFNPDSRGPIFPSPRTRVFFHILAAIVRSPIPLRDRVLCFGSCLWTWPVRRLRVRGGLARRWLREALAGKRRAV